MVTRKKKDDSNDGNLVCNDCGYNTDWKPRDALGKDCPNCGVEFKKILFDFESPPSFCEKCNDYNVHDITCEVTGFTNKGMKSKIIKLICHNCGFERGK